MTESIYKKYENKYYNPTDNGKRPGDNENWESIQKGFYQVEAEQTTQNQEIDALKAADQAFNQAVSRIDAKDSDQDSRLNDIEAEQTTQNQEIDTLKAADQAFNQAVSRIDAKDSDQDSRLNDIEAEQTTQNQEIDALKAAGAKDIKEYEFAKSDSFADISGTPLSVNETVTMAGLKPNTVYYINPIFFIGGTTDRFICVTAAASMHGQMTTNAGGEITYNLLYSAKRLSGTDSGYNITCIVIAIEK